MSTWQDKAAAKRAQVAAEIPTEWELPASLKGRKGDVRGVVAESGLLSARELEITECVEAAVLLEKVAKAEWTAVEVATAFSKRAAIAQQLVNCITEPLFKSAIARAAELDAHLARTGTVVGPLHGLPVSLKEQFDIAGVESTMGYVSKIGRVAKEDAVMIKVLKKLGAVIHCRTNIPQTLLMDESINNIFGASLNPSNTDLTAGGSSGGEAALLAMKGSIVGIGTDLGGSIRKPASFTGLFGLRPTSRRLPYHGASNTFLGAEALESVLGPMANSLDSLEVLMKAVIGAKPWEWDAKVVERTWAEQKGAKRLRIGIMTSDGEVRCHPPIERALDEVEAALKKNGHDVTSWQALDHAGAQEIVSQIFDMDGGEDVRLALGDSGEPILPQVFTSQHPAITVHQSWQLNLKRDEYRQRFLQQWLATGTDEEAPLDAILCATAPHVAAPHLDSPRPGGLITYTTVWSLLDLPCYVFPVTVVDPKLDPKPAAGSYEPMNAVDKDNWEGYSPETYKNAPVCLQLVGCRRFREDELLAMGREIENALGRS